MEPMFIGEPDSQLFAVYHAPASSAPTRDCGVVLCPPGPQESIHTHWPYRRLATLLNRAGFHALRFDYFGTGDSAGEDTQATVARWIEDIATATNELRDVAAVRRIVMVGMRLGAALAVQAANAQPGKIRRLVLWDPVVRGATYLRELHDWQILNDARLLSPPKRGKLPSPADLAGFPYSPAIIEEIKRVDLTQPLVEPSKSPTPAHIFVSHESSEFRTLIDAWTASGRACTLKLVPESTRAELMQGTRVKSTVILEHMADAVTQAETEGR